MSLADNDDQNAYRMSTIISTKPHNMTMPRRDVVVVVSENCSSSTKTLASDICRRLQLIDRAVVVMDLASIGDEASSKSVISLLDYEKDAFFEGVTKESFEHAQHLIVHSNELLWVTRSDPDEAPGHPSKRMISGVMRCVKMEDSCRLLYQLHLSRLLDSDPISTSEAICRRLCTIWDAAEDEDTVEEMETEERDGCFHIARYLPYKAMNESLAYATLKAAVKPHTGNLLQADRPLKLTIEHAGMLDTLRFVDDDTALQPLGENELEITVQACALNFL